MQQSKKGKRTDRYKKSERLDPLANMTVEERLNKVIGLIEPTVDNANTKEDYMELQIRQFMSDLFNFVDDDKEKERLELKTLERFKEWHFDTPISIEELFSK